MDLRSTASAWKTEQSRHQIRQPVDEPHESMNATATISLRRD